MNILHYTIGLPPERHGGSVQYAYDLMMEQTKGHNVFTLICGETLFRSKICKIKYSSIIRNIPIFKLSNPLTPSLIYGTSNPTEQFREVEFDKGNISDFINDNKIDVLHLHTLQGIHKNIVAFIKSLGVKVIYTTHDFHGVCPHYNLLNYTGNLCCRAFGAECAKCNAKEPSDKFLRLANSSLYHSLKKSGLMKILMRFRKNSENEKKKTSALLINANRIAEYETLLNYYRDFFSIIDKFHFNSSQTKDVFNSFIPFAKGDVIPVVTSGIKDKRKPISSGSIVKLGFIGSLNEYKGFPILKNAIEELYHEGFNNINIYVYGGLYEGTDYDCPAITYMPPYDYEGLSDILYNLDGIIVPSKWYETFSLVTLESLAHGRPAFVSNHVGAKDIVSDYGKEYIFSSQDELKTLLKRIATDKMFLENYSNKIMTKPWIYSIQSHAKEIIKFYKS